MKMVSTTAAIASLIGVNLIPLYGVLFQNWNVYSIMLTYWLESAIIGFFTIKKMLKTETSGASAAKTPAINLGSFTYNGQTISSNQAHHMGAKLFYIPFFSMHFGLFMLVHFIFLNVFFFSWEASFVGIMLCTVSLLFSHWVSYQTNFINRHEYQHLSAGELFFRPYPRIIVMHITVILGGFFALSMGSPPAALACMIVLKIIADLGAHLLEHRLRPSVY
ncbi:MAG TPA: DUF6498-containing protein [Vitreimonas sp.]|nr:DUF6498-containing protein [Vitreimonas sp.]